MAGKQVHTTYSHNAHNWRNVSAGASRPAKVFPTKVEAQAAGRTQAIREHAEHYIHDMNGKIAQRNSYGNDPRNIKG